MQSWTIQPIIHPVLLLIALGILLSLLVLQPTYTNLLASRRWKLMALRIGIIAMAFLAALRPGCVQVEERSQSATMIFLADLSRSMELPHQSDDSTRYGSMKLMLEENQGLIDELVESGIEFKFFGFDNTVKEMVYNNGKIELPEQPNGGETDIGTSVFETALQSRKKRVVGMFVASDGVQNVSDPKIELAQAADILDDMSVALYAVPFGTLGDTGQVADVAVLRLPEQHRIAVKNQLNVETIVSARGFANQPVAVQLFVTDSDGIEQLVDTNQFVPDKAYVEQKVLLRHNPQVPGQYRMKVKVTPNGYEVATRNNELQSFLNVYEGGLRVLYIDGGIGWEQSFLRRAISSAAQDVELTRFTIYSDDLSRKREWPLDLSKYFRDPTIDVFIIGDVDSRALFNGARQSENLKALSNAVDQGKGLMMLGGTHSFGPGGFHSTPLDDILPIKMNVNERQDFPPASLRKDLHINEPVKLVPRKDHFITRLGTQVEFREAWKVLPPLSGANRFDGVKDNAEILLESETGQPILVAGQLGGRVLAFAGDSTWRWVMQDYETEFKQFWRQVLLWLANQDGREKNSVWIDLPQRRFQPGSFVSFTCRASDSIGALIPDVEFIAELVKPDQSSVSLVIDKASSKGLIEQGVLSDPGIYQIRLGGKHNGKALENASIEFVVFDRDKEKAIAAADPDQMAKLAAQTKKHGGRVVWPEDFGEVLHQLRDNPPEVIEIPLKWQLGQTAFYGAWYLVIFTALLGTEWVLRKKWGLV